MALLLPMLCPGLFLFTFAAQRLRYFEILTDDNFESADVAFKKCKETNASMMTLYDEQDAKFAFNFTKGCEELGLTRKCWLGLQYVGNCSKWSSGEPVTFLSNNITTHHSRNEQTCVAIENKEWKKFNCSDKKFFMCSKGDNYTLVESAKTWCQALKHCRKKHAELVSIHNETQNETVINRGKNKSFWIGLQLDCWRWDDNGCSSFREWTGLNNEGTIDAKWTGMGINDQSVSLNRMADDSFGLSPFCAKGNVRIKVVNQSQTWENAFDYCKKHYSRLLWITDKHDQQAVEQWLNNYDVGVDGPFWIGLIQSRVFGFWIWAGGTTVWYSNWKGEEPPEMPMSQNCGVIDKDDKKWSDENCLYKRPFLCEEDIIYM
ncbi:macrophage mannose receptor 1-like [Xyrichtys novacula]|uniref:Macrophage mannose receptor 1-like n=1 Tax=Xyrichtys novacula TaxID=13765 RepID=A0AAV1F1Z1_XYRNO|nr:macrophage mannose receptor 1-like [Xyrichtys novacula]